MGAGVKPEPTDLAGLIAQRRQALGAAQGSGQPSGDLSRMIAERRAALGTAGGTDSAPQTPLLGRVANAVTGAATQVLTHPIDTAESLVTAPLASLRDALFTKVNGEQSSDADEGVLGKAGIYRPSGTTYTGAGTETPKHQLAAQAQTVANVAFPAIAKAAAAGAGMLGAGRVLKAGAGLAAAGGTAGAAYDPHDPVAGGIAGAVLAPAIGATLHGAGVAGSALLDRTGLRPKTGPIPKAAPVAQNDGATAAKALQAGSDPALADPENRAVLERPGFIRQQPEPSIFKARPGVGGVRAGGPFIQGDVPQGTVRMTRGGVRETGPFLPGARTGAAGSGFTADQQGLLQRLGIGPGDASASPRSETPAGAERAEALTRLGVTRSPSGPSQGMGSPGYVASGATRIFDPLGKLVPDIAPMSDRAESVLLRALQDAGLSPQEALAKHEANVAAGGKPETFMDLTGKRGARLGRTIRAASPKAGTQIEDALESRSLGAPQRAIDDALEASGIKQRSSSHQTTQQLIEQRATEGKTGYGEAFKEPTPINDPRVTEILKTPAGKSAWKRAVTMMRNDGVDVPIGKQDATIDLPRSNGEPPVKVKGTSLVETPTLQQLHYLKLALDDLKRPGMERGPGQGGIGFNESRSIGGVQQKLLQVMDESSPAYKAARAKYAETSALKDANEAGRRLWKMHPEEAAQTYKELGSDAERDVFRRAGMDALAERLENGPEDVAKGASKPRDLARIRLLFPDDQTFEAFKSRIARESQMHQTTQTVTKGSQTADKLADLADMVQLPSIGRGVRGVAKAVLAARGKVAARGIADAAAPDLLAGTKSPDDLTALLKRLHAASARDGERANRSTTRTRLLGAGAGAVAGQQHQ